MLIRFQNCSYNTNNIYVQIFCVKHSNTLARYYLSWKNYIESNHEIVQIMKKIFIRPVHSHSTINQNIDHFLKHQLYAVNSFKVNHEGSFIHEDLIHLTSRIRYYIKRNLSGGIYIKGNRNSNYNRLYLKIKIIITVYAYFWEKCRKRSLSSKKQWMLRTFDQECTCNLYIYVYSCPSWQRCS